MNFSRLLGATMVAGAGKPEPASSASDGHRQNARRGASRRDRAGAPLKDRRRAADAQRSGAKVAG